MSTTTSLSPVASPVGDDNSTSQPNGTAGDSGYDLLPVIVSLPVSLFLMAALVIVVLLVVLASSKQACATESEEGEDCSTRSREPSDSSAHYSRSRSILLKPLSFLGLGRRGSTGLEMGMRDLSKSQLSSHGSLSSLAKLDHQPHPMQANPTYSISNLSICGTTLEDDRQVVVDEIEPYDTHSCYGQMDSSMVHDFLQSYASVYDQPLVSLTENAGPLDVTEKDIREVRLLGVGQFGRVVLAETIGLSLKGTRLTHIDKGVSIRVALKRLKPDAELEVHEAFQREIKVMSALDHENIVRLLAVCATETPFIIMEYMENGDLNQYLRKCQLAGTSTTKKYQLNVPTLLFMAVQIASGMEYLASLRFVHRDLATRNCLVGQRYTVKIADFGMSRSLYASNYFRLKGRAVLPIRWMASECFFGQFSEKTDVWAFGVTMWEIFELAKKPPYEGKLNAEVVDNAMKGPERDLMPRPHCCPGEVYQVMLRCWEYNPEERACFHDIHSSLAQLYTECSQAEQ